MTMTNIKVAAEVKSAAPSFALPRYSEELTLFKFWVNRVSSFHSKIAYIYQAGGEECRVTYEQLFEDVLLLSRAFTQRGIIRGDRVMLLSDNRYSWIVSDLALIALGAVSVPRGADTPAQEFEYILSHSGATALIIESEKLLDKYDEVIARNENLTVTFLMNGSDMEPRGHEVHSYADLLLDRSYSEDDFDLFFREGEKGKSDDVFTIIYTSGTTGRPKGVQLRHSNVLHNIRVIPGLIKLHPKDKWLSILPSWHIFERTAEYVALAGGTTLVYSSIKSFAQDLEKYKPTLVATVPRVWESLYGRVVGLVRKKGKAAQRLFGSLIWVSSSFRKCKRTLLNRYPSYNSSAGSSLLTPWLRVGAGLGMVVLYPLHYIADKKLGGIRDRFGGQLRLAISGGGTLATYLEDWIDAIGIRIVNAYGMTECSPAIAGRGVACRTYGTLGPPVPETELRVVNRDGAACGVGEEGAIEVRGPQVTPGYLDDEEENRKSFTADGFFKTGDLGKITSKGELILTGRAKEIIVLSNGENIDPTRIENALTMFPFIQDAILVGQDKKGLGALLVPDLEELKNYLSEKMQGFRKETSELLTDGKVLEHVRSEMNRILKPAKGFKPYEQLHGIRFLDKEFALGEELTNTLKKKRHVIEQKYRKMINDLLP